MPPLPFWLKIVVVDLDAKDNDAARGGNQIGDKERPEYLGLMHQPLQHET